MKANFGRETPEIIQAKLKELIDEVLPRVTAFAFDAEGDEWDGQIIFPTVTIKLSLSPVRRREKSLASHKI